MKNQKIRQAAVQAGVRLWEIAMALGITDSMLSRKLRVELPEDERDRILGIIDHIKDGDAS